jgi:2-succinyl-6-hydroxy-2,4-cyclohexadiene-1-carboxylate synthase
MNIGWLPGFLALPDDPLPVPARVVPLDGLLADGGVAALSQIVGPDDLLVGYSMGGRIALTAVAAGLRPAGLVLLSTHPGLADDTARAQRRAVDAQRAVALLDDPASFIENWPNEPVFAASRNSPRWCAQQQARRARVAAERTPTDPGPWARAQSRILSAFSPGVLPSSWDALASIPTPTRWFAGALDAAYADLARRAAAAMPDAEAQILPGVGHALPLEAPAAIADLLTPFIAAVRRKRGMTC